LARSWSSASRTRSQDSRISSDWSNPTARSNTFGPLAPFALNRRAPVKNYYFMFSVLEKLFLTGKRCTWSSVPFSSAGVVAGPCHHHFGGRFLSLDGNHRRVKRPGAKVSVFLHLPTSGCCWYWNTQQDRVQQTRSRWWLQISFHFRKII
jgi:hypothetical protein